MKLNDGYLSGLLSDRAIGLLHKIFCFPIYLFCLCSKRCIYHFNQSGVTYLDKCRTIIHGWSSPNVKIVLKVKEERIVDHQNTKSTRGIYI